MSDFVQLPADAAKQYAAALRSENTSGLGLTPHDRDALADLLDPRPPSLREQVTNVIGRPEAFGTDVAHADAVLAVVADWLAAQPIHDGTAVGLWGLEPRAIQRDRDVRLIRGEVAS